MDCKILRVTNLAGRMTVNLSFFRTGSTSCGELTTGRRWHQIKQESRLRNSNSATELMLQLMAAIVQLIWNQRSDH